MPFFYIIGRPRSGTTLLRTMLDAHPNVAIPHESQVILNFSGKYGNITNWGERELNHFFDDLNHQQIFGVWNIDQQQLKSSLLECTGETSFQDLIRMVYLHFSSIYHKSDVQIIGDKNPVYSYNFKQLYPVFPDAKYIHLTRDYRDQIFSMKKMDFEIHHPALVALRWRLSVESINRFKQQAPEKFYSIGYEDLVGNPENQLCEICKFLDIPFDPVMLEFHSKNAGNDFLPDEAMKKYHSSLFNPVNKAKVNIWEKKLSKRDVKIADMIVGESAENNGYTRIYRGFYPMLWLSVSPFLLYGYLWNLWRKVVNRLPLRIKMMVKNASPVFPAIYHKLAMVRHQNKK